MRVEPVATVCPHSHDGVPSSSARHGDPPGDTDAKKAGCVKSTSSVMVREVAVRQNTGAWFTCSTCNTNML